VKRTALRQFIHGDLVVARLFAAVLGVRVAAQGGQRLTLLAGTHEISAPVDGDLFELTRGGALDSEHPPQPFDFAMALTEIVHRRGDDRLITQVIEALLERLLGRDRTLLLSRQGDERLAEFPLEEILAALTQFEHRLELETEGADHRPLIGTPRRTLTTSRGFAAHAHPTEMSPPVPGTDVTAC
jgi:hypothetical protein